MRRLKRAAAAAGMTAVLILWTGASVFGADSSVIEKITITFKTAYGEPEEIPDPEITVNGTGCSLGDVQFRTEYDNWKPGKKVRTEITVNADSGKIEAEWKKAEEYNESLSGNVLRDPFPSAR